MRLARMQMRRRLLAALARDGAGRQCGIFQRVQRDVVGIGKGGLLAAHRAHADALVDTEAAGFDDAFFQRPALGTAVLEIEIGVIHTMRQHLAEHLLQMAGFQSVRGEQRTLRQLQG